MIETCAVCKKGKGPEKCEVCGFSDNGFINRNFPIPEDAVNWLETVVKPYRVQWEAEKREAELLERLERAGKKEAELSAQLEEARRREAESAAKFEETLRWKTNLSKHIEESPKKATAVPFPAKNRKISWNIDWFFLGLFLCGSIFGGIYGGVLRTGKNSFIAALIVGCVVAIIASVKRGDGDGIVYYIVDIILCTFYNIMLSVIFAICMAMDDKILSEIIWPWGIGGLFGGLFGGIMVWYHVIRDDSKIPITYWICCIILGIITGGSFIGWGLTGLVIFKVILGIITGGFFGILSGIDWGKYIHGA